MCQEFMTHRPAGKRRGRDSNPRYGCPHTGFRVHPLFQRPQSGAKGGTFRPGPRLQLSSNSDRNQIHTAPHVSGDVSPVVCPVARQGRAPLFPARIDAEGLRGTRTPAGATAVQLQTRCSDTEPALAARGPEATAEGGVSDRSALGTTCSAGASAKKKCTAGARSGQQPP